MQHQCLYCGELHPPEDTCVSLPKAISLEEVLAAKAHTHQQSSALASPIVVVSNPLEDTISDFDEGAARAAALLRESNRTEPHSDDPYNTRLPTLLGIGKHDVISSPTKPSRENPPNQKEHRDVPDDPMERIYRAKPPKANAEHSPRSALTKEGGTLAEINESTIGSYIGDYEIVSFLGEGGMGRVYQARHSKDGRDVAIKILKPEIANHDESVRRFFREAQVVNGVQHPNIIDIVDLGRTRYGEYFLLMELLQGEPLRVALEKSAPFSPSRIVHITEQICSALQACHQKGVVHRDLKSDNIFLITTRGQRDFVKILDFGLAKLYKSNAGIDAAPMVSAPGMILGTPVCMSPEQALGEEIDQQTDIYALGVLLYQMATGHLPFFDPNPIVLLKLHLTTEPIRPSKHAPSLSKPIESIILRCLEKEKRRRYRSAQEVALALRAVIPADDVPATQRRPISNSALFSLAAATFIAALLLTWLLNALMS